jgi:uncharacterized protein YjiS (DUF1127 family)
MATCETALTRMPAGARGARTNLLTAALMAVDTWIERHRQRNALLGLNDAQLKDIGISRADAVREGEKHFWTR